MTYRGKQSKIPSFHEIPEVNKIFCFLLYFLWVRNIFSINNPRILKETRQVLKKYCLIVTPPVQKISKFRASIPYVSQRLSTRNVPLQWMVLLRPDGEDLWNARNWVSQKFTNCQQVGWRDISTESCPPTCLSIDDQVISRSVWRRLLKGLRGIKVSRKWAFVYSLVTIIGPYIKQLLLSTGHDDMRLLNLRRWIM